MLATRDVCTEDLKDFIQAVKPHKRASVLHKAERISSHCNLEEPREEQTN